MQGIIALQNFLIPCFPLDKLQINQLLREQVLSSTGASAGVPGRAQAAAGKGLPLSQVTALNTDSKKCNSIPNPGEQGGSVREKGEFAKTNFNQGNSEQELPFSSSDSASGRAY